MERGAGQHWARVPQGTQGLLPALPAVSPGTPRPWSLSLPTPAAATTPASRSREVVPLRANRGRWPPPSLAPTVAWNIPHSGSGLQRCGRQGPGCKFSSNRQAGRRGPGAPSCHQGRTLGDLGDPPSLLGPRFSHLGQEGLGPEQGLLAQARGTLVPLSGARRGDVRDGPARGFQTSGPGRFLPRTFTQKRPLGGENEQNEHT